jgi:hypothetical protein
MKMLDFLTGQSANATLDESFLIGDTGFSLGKSQQPALPLAQWKYGEIPKSAREVLQAQCGFSGFAGLLRVPIKPDASGATHADWILGRTSSGLLSVVVREASRCDAARLRDDMAYAVAEAKRYCAAGVIVLVQQGRNDSTSCRDALQGAFGAEVVETDVLYKCDSTSTMPVWFASLSFCQE